METPIFLNVSKRIDFILTEIGVGVTGQTVLLNIRRNSDNKWWDGDSWEAGKTNLSMTEKDSTNEKGLYVYNWTPDGLGEYTLTFSIASGVYTTSVSETITVVADYSTNSTTIISSLGVADRFVKWIKNYLQANSRIIINK